MSIRDTIRRMGNRHWWFAHRHEMPGHAHVAFLLLCLLILAGATYVVKAADALEAAQDIDAQNKRVLECINTGGSLGTFEEGGVTWSVTCQIVLRKVAPSQVERQ